MQRSNVPPQVRATLEAKCADCHSMQTRAPLYGRFAPFSWLMERDIVNARAAMNLSEWEQYSAEDQEAYKVKILLETKAGKMPLPQYRFIHWSSVITTNDMETLAAWAHQRSPAALVQLTQTDIGDAARGKDVFERRCTGCHSLDQNREGPRLRNVFGRDSASVPDFTYSTALKQIHVRWDEGSLERWLTDPDTVAPGTDMEFHVPKPQERADLIRFLKDSAK
jgi:cytochrome c